MRLRHVGHGDPDVVPAAQPGNAGACRHVSSAHRSSVAEVAPTPRLDPIFSHLKSFSPERTRLTVEMDALSALAWRTSTPVKPLAPSTPTPPTPPPPVPGKGGGGDAPRQAPVGQRRLDRPVQHGRGLEGRRPRAAGHHARPAPPDPGVRGDRPRAGGRGPGARPRALLHRPGGRRCRLDRLAPVPTRSTARIGATTSSWPRRSATSPRGRSTLAALVTPAVAEVLRRTLAEILGLAQGYCAGRGGSMHLQWLQARAGHQRDRRRRRPDGGRQRLGAAAQSPARPRQAHRVGRRPTAAPT